MLDRPALADKLAGSDRRPRARSTKRSRQPGTCERGPSMKSKWVGLAARAVDHDRVFRHVRKLDRHHGAASGWPVRYQRALGIEAGRCGRRTHRVSPSGIRATPTSTAPSRTARDQLGGRQHLGRPPRSRGMAVAVAACNQLRGRVVLDAGSCRPAADVPSRPVQPAAPLPRRHRARRALPGRVAVRRVRRRSAPPNGWCD